MKQVGLTGPVALGAVAALALALAAWLWLASRDDMQQIRGREADLAQLLALKQDLVAAGGDAGRVDAPALIRKHLGPAAQVESREDAGGEGWTVRRHVVSAADVGSASVDAFFAACEASKPRLLLEKIEVAASAPERLSVQFTVAELVKN